MLTVPPLGFAGNSVGGADFDSEQEIAHAVEALLAAVDSKDIGSTVSEEELYSHLNSLLTGKHILPVRTT